MPTTRYHLPSKPRKRMLEIIEQLFGMCAVIGALYASSQMMLVADSSDDMMMFTSLQHRSSSRCSCCSRQDQMHANSSVQLPGAILRGRAMSEVRTACSSSARTVPFGRRPSSLLDLRQLHPCLSYGTISWPHTGWSVRFKGRARAERAAVPCTAVEPLSRYSQARPSGLKTVVLCIRHRQ